MLDWHFRIRWKSGVGLCRGYGGRFRPLPWHAVPGQAVCYHGVYVTGRYETVRLVVGWSRGAEGLWFALSDEPTWPKTLGENALSFMWKKDSWTRNPTASNGSPPGCATATPGAGSIRIGSGVTARPRRLGLDSKGLGAGRPVDSEAGPRHRHRPGNSARFQTPARKRARDRGLVGLLSAPARGSHNRQGRQLRFVSQPTLRLTLEVPFQIFKKSWRILLIEPTIKLPTQNNHLRLTKQTERGTNRRVSNSIRRMNDR